jgi:hypothetical protein
MVSTDTAPPVVQIGVYAARDGWLLTHPSVQSRFEDREEALAAAQRLAHLESWRGHLVDVLVEERSIGEIASFDPRR